MWTLDHALGEFAAAWKAGTRPQIEDYFEHLDPAQHDEFLDLVQTWMEVAPAPAFDDSTYARIAADPSVVAAVETVRVGGQSWPHVIRELRERRKLTLLDAARRFVGAAGLDGGDERAAWWLSRIEKGEAEPSGMTRQAFDALGRVFGVSGRMLEDAGSAWRPVAPGRLLWRTDAPAQAELGEHLDVLADVAAAAAAPATGPNADVDHLFTAGREG